MANASSAAASASSIVANARSDVCLPSPVECCSSPRASPIRSTDPVAGAVPVSASTRLYFSDDDPALSTSTWELTSAPGPGSP